MGLHALAFRLELVGSADGPVEVELPAGADPAALSGAVMAVCEKAGITPKPSASKFQRFLALRKRDRRDESDATKRGG